METLTDILQKKFIGTDDLRRELTDVLSRLSRDGGEIVVTQHGKPQAVLLDMEAYLNLRETLADLQTPGLIESVYEGAREVDDGEGLSVEQLKRSLKL